MSKRFPRFVGACIGAAILAACSGSNGVVPSTVMHGAGSRHGANVRHGTSSGSYEVLHSFGGSGDGSGPDARLALLDGLLYGTTAHGGGSGCASYDGCGTVFSITTGGTEAVLHSFGGGDGDGPGGLTNLNGTFYGTTASGGAHNKGTVFSVTTSGTQTVLHSFAGNPDGYRPSGGLIVVNGTLYGVTTEGGGIGCGNFGCGTVFSITPGGTETVLHSFGNAGDGSNPVGGFVAVNGALYGVTANGGQGYPEGTVFEISPGGSESVVYRFSHYGGDGENPGAGLAEVNGILYGTTAQGGAHGRGTVFSVTPYGTETVLHSFGGPGDPGNPQAELHPFGGILYGTTASNGGTVFSITTSGTEAVLHTFWRFRRWQVSRSRPEGGQRNAIRNNLRRRRE